MGYGEECGEHRAFGQDERGADAVGWASDKIPEAGVGHIDGQGIVIASFSGLRMKYGEAEKMDCENCKELNTLRKIVASVDKLRQYDSNIDNYVLLNPKSAYCCNFTLDGYIKLEQENQTLKDKWQKLKEYVEGREDHNNECDEDERLIEDNIIWAKMQEMEEEE